MALKTIQGGEYKEFLTEALMLQSLNHPNILRFFGVFTNKENQHFIVTEYMAEGSLQRLVEVQRNNVSSSELMLM